MKKTVFFLILAVFAFADFYQGKVMAKYTQNRFGKEWLSLNISQNGRILQVLLTPVNQMSKIGINKGDSVIIDGYRPPLWPPMLIKAYKIFDQTQNRHYTLGGSAIMVK